MCAAFSFKSLYTGSFRGEYSAMITFIPHLLQNIQPWIICKLGDENAEEHLLYNISTTTLIHTRDMTWCV